MLRIAYKMQINFFLFWVLAFGEGAGELGVDLAGTKSQVFPKILFESSPTHGLVA